MGFTAVFSQKAGVCCFSFTKQKKSNTSRLPCVKEGGVPPQSNHGSLMQRRGSEGGIVCSASDMPY